MPTFVFDRTGVFRTSSESDAVREQAGTKGWHTVTINTAGVNDKDGFMATMAEAFDFPLSQVTSWAVLDECLRVIDLDEPDGLLVLWDQWGDFAVADPEGFDLAVEVLKDACVAWHDDDFHGTVLLRGSGPETDIPLL